MSLAIHRNSWHFRLHSFVRSMWGMPPTERSRWSLCPYFQTLLWGTVLTSIFVLPAALGWLFVKALRIFYKAGLYFLPLSWFVSLCDKTILGKMLDDAPSKLKSNFIPSGMFWLGLLVSLSSILFLAGLACYAIATSDWSGIVDLPSLLWTALCYVGYAIMYVFGLFGWIFNLAWTHILGAFVYLIEHVPVAFFACIDFLTNSQMWLGIWNVVYKILLGIASLVSIGLVVYVVSSIPFVVRLLEWTEMKTNGYSEARARNIEQSAIKNSEQNSLRRIDQYSRIREVVLHYSILKESPKSLADSAFDAVESALLWIKTTSGKAKDGVKALYSRETLIDGKVHEQLGPIGIVWKMLVAFKQGVCPVIEFVDDSH